MKKKILVLLTTLCMLVITGTASAGLIAYNDRASWEAAVGGVFTEQDFSTIASQAYDVSPIDVGDFTVSVTGTNYGSNWHFIGTGGPNNVNGTQQLHLATGDVGGTTLDFDPEIYAFGADFGGVSDSRTTSFIIGGMQLDIPNLNGGFFGFVADGNFGANLLQLTDGSADGFAMDNLVYAYSSVPEPTSLILLCLGLLGLGGTRHRRLQSA